MAVAHDASSQSHASASFSVSQASFSWTHTPTGTPKGVTVLVFQGVASADAVTSVTYGGTTMTHVSSARAADTATEPGSVDVYFLGSSVSTGAQTVQVNRTNNTTSMWAVCSTQTAATDTEIAGIVLVQNDGAIAQQSVDDGSTGVNSVRYSGVYYGGATPAPAGANSTLLGTTNDAGAYGWTAVRETTAGQGSRLVGCTQATSDDRAIVAFAVREVYVPPGPTYVGSAADPAGADVQATSRSVTKPAGAQLAVFFLSYWTLTSTTTPPGAAVQRINQAPGAGSAERSLVYLMYVDGDATGTTYTFSNTASEWASLKAQFWSNVPLSLDLTNTTNFPASSAVAATTTAYPSVSVTALANSVVCWGGNAFDYGTGTATTPPTSFTETGDTVSSAMAYRFSAAGGSVTASSAVYGESTNLQSVLIAIPPTGTTGGTTGTVAVTQASDTSAASGQLGYSGTSAATQAPNTSSATGTVVNPVTGTAAVTQANQTSTASGTFTGTGVSGTVAVTQAANTATAAGQLGYSGTSARTQANQISTASGQLGYSGTATATQAAQTSSATGQLGYSGSVAATQAAQTASASGTYTASGSFSGTVAVTQANQTASAVGQLGYSGTVARTQANQTSTASGTVVNPVTGTASPTQANQTAAASGKLGYSGTVSVVQANNISTATGLVVIPITGTVAALQANQVAVIVGQFTGLVTFGTASAGAGTRPTAQGATASTPTAYAAAAGAASASSRIVTAPTATGG